MDETTPQLAEIDQEEVLAADSHPPGPTARIVMLPDADPPARKGNPIPKATVD